MNGRNTKDLISNRATPLAQAVDLPILPRRRPTQPASEFLAAVSQADPQGSADWAAKAAVERAGELIRDARLAAGLSQQELAARVGTTQSTISDIERGAGKYGPSFGVLHRMASACGFAITLVPQAPTADARIEVERAAGGSSPISGRAVGAIHRG